MTIEENRLIAWKDLCIKSFENDSIATEFIQFVLTGKQKEHNSYYWTTKPTFSVSEQTLQELLQEKDKARSYWHFHHRAQTKQAITECIEQTHRLHISQVERITLFRQFVRQYGSNPACRSFFRGLDYLLTLQLGKDSLVEWNMPEFILVDTDYAEAYIQLLIGVLYVQVVYQDQAYISIPMASDYNTLMAQQASDQMYLLRLSSDTSDEFIQKVHRAMPKGLTVTLEDQSHYTITDIPRTMKPKSSSGWKSIVQWIFSLFRRCFSFFFHRQ
ncbi:hypothetical protein BD560DRAFT_424513 [Blakeslea trispora]|nr:hypothetical protein BD560DRAFT_424513 [Blakeslea trispora]